MESLGEILKKRKTQIGTSKENTVTWSNAELSEEQSLPCPVCKGAEFVHPRLASGEVDYDQVVPCRCVQKDLEKSSLTRLQRFSNLGNLIRLSFDNLISQGRSGDPENQERFLRASKAATGFAQNPQGWLVFMGPSGCGKTHLTAAIANYCLQQKRLVYFQPVSDLLDHLRSTFSPNSDISCDELFEQVKNVPLLILDDLGRQNSSPWAEEKLFQLINYRHSAQLPTVINISAVVSLEEIDERWVTRLTDPNLSQLHLLEEKKSPVLDYIGNLELELLGSRTFENFDSKRIDLQREQRQNLENAFRLAQRFAQSPEDWLIFQGTNGCGKTHLAAAIANYILRGGKSVSFVIVPDFLDHLRSTFSPDSKVNYDELFERAKTSPLLILDDFGEHSSTPWAQEKLYQLINYRYNDRLPTIITMCCSLDEIETRISSRMADHSLSTVFNIIAPDYRADRHSIEKPKTRKK